ncbi:hypothetical protein GA0070216_112119 [Micromonospora matsumotoense]|uniref:Uncharacterized protein n=1 Tax=Micromonospora matsumotoense TaxID=121616 RepID=A0A1C5A0D7_9ACTN|nr:hypothetical protein GA0070216_112119 [Micromonospora matsumotoense]
MEYRRDRVALSIYLASQLFEATADLVRLNPHPAPSPAELFDRFLAWTARPPTRAGIAPVPATYTSPSPSPDPDPDPDPEPEPEYEPQAGPDLTPTS